MKKLFVLLLAFAMVAGAFAQVNFTGYLDTGFMIEKEGSADAEVSLYGDDSGTQSRFNLAGAYSNENVGVTFRLRVQGDFDGAAPAPQIFMNRGFVWAKMFDDMVKVQAGRLGDYTWATWVNYFGNLDTKTGVQLQIMPMDGLNFGLFMPVTTAAVALEDTFKSLVIGAAYSAEDFGKFVAGVKLSPLDDSMDAWAGAQITAVENLVVYVEYEGTDLGNDVTGATYLFEEIDYTMGDLNFGIDLEQQFWANDALDMGLSFGPYVNYTIEAITLGGQFTYYTADDSGMLINPYAKYAVGPGALIEFGAYLYSGDIQDVEATALTDNTTQIYLSFTWSF